MLYTEDLDCISLHGCSDPACDHAYHEEIFLSPKCHGGSGLVLSYQEANRLQAACACCHDHVFTVATAETKPLIPACHPDAAVCLSHRLNTGNVQVTCRECGQLVTSILVHYAGIRLDGRRTGKPRKAKERRKGKKHDRLGPDRSSTRTKGKPSDNRIKIHVSFPDAKPGEMLGEFLQARRISADTAKIESIPFCTATVARGDLVRFAANGDIKEVLERAARTRGLVFVDDDELTDDDIEQRFKEVREQLGQYDIEVEEMAAGFCSISVPLDVDDEQLALLADRLDATLILHEDADEDEEE